MNLNIAKGYAEKIVTWLGPLCDLIVIAGSIRRARPVCNDVDIVCIPKITITTDLLGAPQLRVNHVLTFLQQYVSEQPDRAQFISGNRADGKQIIIQLPKCQLDLWFASESNFGTRWLCRTGSKEHNILLSQRALDLGGSWNPYEGVSGAGGQVSGGAAESDVYHALGLPFIEPKLREGPFTARLIKERIGKTTERRPPGTARSIPQPTNAPCLEAGAPPP